MRLVPGSARAALNERTQKQSGSASMNLLPSALMFFDGVMPDAATLRTRYAAGMTGAPRQVNLYNALSPHSSQYMGCIGWRYGFVSSLMPGRRNEIEIDFSYNGDSYATSAATVDSDPIATRQARIHRAGKPTWFAIAHTFGSGYLACNSDSLPVLNNANQLYFAVTGTVGDEDSTADLKLVGGSIFLTQSNPVDLSKVPIIANLRIQLP